MAETLIKKDYTAIKERSPFDGDPPVYRILQNGQRLDTDINQILPMNKQQVVAVTKFHADTGRLPTSYQELVPYIKDSRTLKSLERMEGVILPNKKKGGPVTKSGGSAEGNKPTKRLDKAARHA